MSSAVLPVRFVWVDLEMTGLNPQNDAILEIAVVVTGPDLQPLDEIERVVFQPEVTLERMSDRVRRMHTKNGLLTEVRERSVEIRIAEHNVLQMISKHAAPGQGMLCGRSVDHDWKFLTRYMPRIEQHMHFQRLDVASIAVLVDQWFPQLAYQPPATNHRAMADVRAGLDEMRFYCANAFKVDLARLFPRGGEKG